MQRRFNNQRNFRKKFSHNTQTATELVRAIRAVQLVKKTENNQPETPYISNNGFEDFPISKELKDNIFYKKYATPTPIQDKAIPAIMDGQDIIGIANTGTGKTAAFLIPLIDKVSKNRAERVFIVAPTRELTLQINEELRSFARGMGIRAVLCIGGMSTFRQISDLRQNPNFVIGTPGRIKDLIQRKALNLSQFNNVVLDEADRMVDIGFINEIKYFISLLSPNRQSLFFSATVSGKVKEILKSFVNNPMTISVEQQGAPESIDQDIVKVINKEQKIDQLHDLLIQKGFDKILVFGRTKWGVQKLANELVKRGFKAGAIHDNKSQGQRQRTLSQFKTNAINILLATDVASRGLDIPDVTHVINYDIPATYDDYIHRIGRTGRADKKGIALTFIE